MIRSLRKRHRLAVSALALVLPVLFVAGLASRQETPTQDDLGFLTSEASEGLQPFAGSEDAWHGLPIRTTWLRDPTDETRVAVRLEMIDTMPTPDLLLYWSTSAGEGDSLPADALLLGRFGHQPRTLYELPGVAREQAGRLLIYSLARHEVVGSTELTAPGGGQP